MTKGIGHVWLVGAGPGDPGLITVAGAAALASAEVVLVDALVSEAVLRHVRAETEVIPVGKRAGAHSMKQDEINALMLAKALEGKRVVRLKGGDPFVFGRGGEEALACRGAGIQFTIVPGITSAVAVPAYAGIPVTHRGLARSFTVVTAAEAGGSTVEWETFTGGETLVVLMGAVALTEVAQGLIAAGRDPSTPAASISDGTTPRQRTVVATLETIAQRVAEERLNAPLLTVVGEVAALANEIAWRGAAPLAGRSVVVTRTRTQASGLKALLESLGADVIEAPVLEIRHDATELTTDERMSSRWDWIVFSSQNGVEAFFGAVHTAGKDARALGSTQVAVVGAATAGTLERFGIRADFVPATATGECLAEELPGVSGARILVAEGSLADGRLASGLRARGGHVERVQLYSTSPARLSDELAAKVRVADAITFASASSAQFLRESLGAANPGERTRLCAIGPQAAAAVEAAFGRCDSRAKSPSIEGLAAAVVEALS